MPERTFPAQDDALDDLIGFVEETLESLGCSMKLTISLCVALEEIFVNVAHYAYKDGCGDVSLSITHDEEKGSVIFEMSDRGVEFNPLKRPDPDVTLSADEREIGGLGIFITKKTMDSISYRYENEKNILTMIKMI